MFRRRFVATVLSTCMVSFTALSTAAAPAAAAAPQPVSIVSVMAMTQPFNTGAFDATGTDLICPSGTVTDTRLLQAWPHSFHARLPIGFQEVVDKTFTCGDDVIYLRLAIHVSYWDATEAFTWVVLGGTGEYAHLQGHGTGTSEYLIVDDTLVSVTNYYSGWLIG